MALGRAGANIQLLSNKIYPGHQETAGKDKVESQYLLIVTLLPLYDTFNHFRLSLCEGQSSRVSKSVQCRCVA